MNLVFIAGIGHSGSTLLSMILGAFPNALSVGEIDKLICSRTQKLYMDRYIHKEKYPCSCGETPSACPFWSEFTPIIEKNKSDSYGTLYLEAIEIAKQKFGMTHFVDCSKNIHALRRIKGTLDLSNEPITLKVIHLVKDVRNLTNSNVRSGRVRGVLRNYKQWLNQNSEFESFLEKHNISTLKVGYEELAISTSFTIDKISEFLGIDLKQNNKKLYPENSHILFGNNMRLDKKKSIQIEYDYHWLTNFRNAAWYSLYPGLHKKNMEWCYSNAREKFGYKI